MKTLSIIGIILAALSFFCIIAFEYSAPTAAAGWGMYAAAYLLAISIVALVKSKK
jgi:hypothetical protein